MWAPSRADEASGATGYLRSAMILGSLFLFGEVRGRNASLVMQIGGAMQCSGVSNRYLIYVLRAQVRKLTGQRPGISLGWSTLAHFRAKRKNYKRAERSITDRMKAERRLAVQQTVTCALTGLP